MKKEITIAASSAIALIILLGSASYLLFPQVPVQAYTATIDVYTQRGGHGKDKPSGNFTPPETVYLYAEVKNASNTPLGAKLVSFEVHWPNNETSSILILGTATTNSSGIAEEKFGIPPSTNSIGRWLVYVTAQVDEQIVVDTLTFWCNG
ncbi:MAG: hypothetical protein ACUVT5_03905 [Candidatus Bathyarchaeales archaeon]